jgi:hypothetical protein
LRQSEHVIFIVGTNYADRIDRAIKRAGRIDERLLVLPPDLSRREQIIRESLEKLGDERSENSAQIREAAVAGYWRTIAEIKAAIRGAVRGGGSLTDAMAAVVPAISLEAYMSRLNSFSDENSTAVPAELLEETFLLTYLLMQGRDDEPLPVKYDGLVNRWTARTPGIVRDPAVEDALNSIFARS